MSERPGPPRGEIERQEEKHQLEAYGIGDYVDLKDWQRIQHVLLGSEEYGDLVGRGVDVQTIDLERSLQGDRSLLISSLAASKQYDALLSYEYDLLDRGDSDYIDETLSAAYLADEEFRAFYLKELVDRPYGHGVSWSIKMVIGSGHIGELVSRLISSRAALYEKGGKDYLVSLFILKSILASDVLADKSDLAVQILEAYPYALNFLSAEEDPGYGLIDLLPPEGHSEFLSIILSAVAEGCSSQLAANLAFSQHPNSRTWLQTLFEEGEVEGAIHVLEAVESMGERPLRGPFVIPQEYAILLEERGRRDLVLANLDIFGSASLSELVKLVAEGMSVKELLEYVAPDEAYADASFTEISPGFSRAAMGRIIRRRIEAGLERNIHDATQWMAEMVEIPSMAADIEAIKSQVEEVGRAEVVERALYDKDVEENFLGQLLHAKPELRQRLTYGTRTGLSDREKLDILFKRDGGLRGQFSAELGRAQAEMTNAFYAEVLAEDAELRARYDAAMAEGQKPKKFFAEGLSEDQVGRLQEKTLSLRVDLEQRFLAEVLAADSEMEQYFASQEMASGEDWFYGDVAHSILYKAAVEDVEGKPFYKHESFNGESWLERAQEAARNYEHQQIGHGKDEVVAKWDADDVEKLIKDVEHIIEDRLALNPAFEDSSRLGECAQKLNAMRYAREQYVKDVQVWLDRHATTKSDTLTQVWADRAAGLAEGVQDGAQDLLFWQKSSALRLMLVDLESSGALQTKYGLSRQEVVSKAMEADRNELTRRLSVKNTIEALSKLKKWRAKSERQEKLLPAASVVIPQANGSRETVEYRMDILDKDDPRGFTIGEDTGCCMTIHGASSSCIKAGYTRQNAGFLALYNPEGLLIAQSFFYVHPERPEVLVLDNIEANQGRDRNKIASIYREGLRQYIADHPGIGLLKVHMGTGYTDIDYSDMPKVAKKVPNLPGEYVYTDADGGQRLMLEVEDVFQRSRIEHA